MALDLATIAAGIKTTLEASLTDWIVYETQPGDPVLASSGGALVVVSAEQPENAYYQSFHKAGAVWSWDIDAYVQATDVKSAQTKLLALMSAGTGQASSLLDAIEADRTLDGSVSDCRLRSVSRMTTASVSDGAMALTVTFQLETHTPRS